MRRGPLTSSRSTYVFALLLIFAARNAVADSSARSAATAPQACSSSTELKPFYVEKRYEAAFLHYLDVVAENAGDKAVVAIRQKEKQLFRQCVALRSTTHRFHQEESLIADEEYERICYEGLAPVWDHPDDIETVRRNLEQHD
jgi:hypothetical protein